MVFVSFPRSLFPKPPFIRIKPSRSFRDASRGPWETIGCEPLFPFLRKYIPGNPAIVSEFMPGGGGRKGTNHIFSSGSS